MLILYKGKRHEIEPNTRVMIDVRNVFSAGYDQNWQPATVIDILSVQFTAELEDKAVIYRHFSDVGRSWEPIT